MINIYRFLKFLCKCILVAIGYLVGVFVAGILCSLLGIQLPAEAGSGSRFIPIFIASIFLGIFLGPYASRLSLSSGQHFILWGTLILFNLGSVIIEGAYFAPDLVSVAVPVLITQQLLATTGAAFVITQVFATRGEGLSWKNAIQTRPWYSWMWRFLASALSYLFFYFAIGSLNYQLVTQRYYESHANGLTVPPVQTILAAESIRCLFIVVSIFLFLLSARENERQLMISSGWLLFAVGGIVPLFWQVGTLPLPLLLASAVEIFFQNFLTGGVSAWLMGIKDREELNIMLFQRN